jgi:hypothetical protein
MWTGIKNFFYVPDELVEEFLPIGVEAFHEWAEKVIKLTHLPSNDSIKFALASIILELDKTKGRICRHEMATMLVKAAANQVAAFVFQDIKNRRIEAEKKLADHPVDPPPPSSPPSSGEASTPDLSGVVSGIKTKTKKKKQEAPSQANSESVQDEYGLTGF